MSLHNYMQEKFLDLSLRPPLFYNWDIGIRFALGADYHFHNDPNDHLYLKEVYKRAITLFESIHLPENDLYIVVDVNVFADDNSSNANLIYFLNM